MATFMFSYRVPEDYRLGRPEMAAAWTAWFEALGASRVDPGHGAAESHSLGNCWAGTRLGGYSIIAADDLEAALALAKGCPAVGLGGGIEVGVIPQRHPGSGPAGND
jgi:hypothetical protein